MSLLARAIGRGAEALGLAWALGMALFTALSFVLYVAGAPDGTAVVAAFVAALSGALVAVRAVWASRRGDARADVGAPAGRPFIAIVALALAGGRVALAVAQAGRTPFAAYDAWSFWALKARMFALGGPRPGYFRDPLTLHTHPDYPLNLPLAEALFLRLPGALGVTLAASIGPACLAALLLLLYAGLTRLHGPTTAALATGTLSFVPALAAQAAGGDADVPLAMYAGGSALYLLLWWRLRRPADALLMGLLAGGALWTKKEGLPVAALLLTAYLTREALRAAGPSGGHTVSSREKGACAAWGPLGVLATSAVFPLPWLLFCRAVRPLGRDFLPLTPSVFLAHIDRLPHILALFALQTLDFANWSLLWVLLAVALPLAARRFPPPGRGLLLLLLGQIGVYALSFVFSDWQPYTAHVQTSLDRLLVQATPLALLLLVESIHALGAIGGRRALAEERAGLLTHEAAA